MSSDHVYKSLDLTGSSKNSIEEPVNNAIGRAAKTVKHLRWFEVKDIRGVIDGDAVEYWQVRMSVGFTME
jgi:flavin-binding protein dodecin